MIFLCFALTTSLPSFFPSFLPPFLPFPLLPFYNSSLPSFLTSSFPLILPPFLTFSYLFSLSNSLVLLNSSSSLLFSFLFDFQLAFFHPSFMWADTDFDEPLNYEKRAPFPTINLLRAAKIREFTSEVRTLPAL